ncbi:MAG: hypothetical protein ABIZ70_10575 [Gemmatimonadales bacterium]
MALLAWIAHLSFPGEKTRRGITVAAAAYAALWTTVWAMGLEPRGTFAIYTSPGEKLVNVIVGVMLISSAISNSAFPPLRQAASWLGIGLVLAGATGIAAYPLSQAMQAASPAHSWMVKPFASIFGHVGLVLWCIPYWKKNVVWTQ